MESNFDKLSRLYRTDSPKEKRKRERGTPDKKPMMQKRDMRGVQGKRRDTPPTPTSHADTTRGKIEKEEVKCVCHTKHFRGAIFHPSHLRYYTDGKSHSRLDGGWHFR